MRITKLLGVSKMAEDNNKKKARERNEKAKSILKVTEVKTEDGAEHSTGAAAFVTFFNSLVDEVEKKAQKEADKPRYRFLEIMNSTGNRQEEVVGTPSISAILYSHEFVETVSELQERLKEYKYTVEIIENLDCKDVTQESRYFIRIRNNNGIYVDLDLFTYEQNIKNFSFNEQEFIENQIAKIVGSTTYETKEVAEYIVDYIAHIMYFRELYTLTYKKIGWDTYNWNSVGWIFKYDRIYSLLPIVNGGGQAAYTEDLEVCSMNSRREVEWVSTTIDLINNHEYCAMILGAGISGLVRQLLPYTKENNININIQGKAASGKSTICHYLLGIFGNPEKIEGSFTDTANSMEEIRARRPILPYVLDERMLKVENDTEKTKQQTILMDIFREYEGKVKERLGKQYEEERGERIYGPIISSSVRSVMDYVFKSDDLGQYRRFIEFNIGGKEDKLLFSGKEEADLIEEAAYKNYGFGVKVIVDYMLILLDEGNDIEIATVFINRYNALISEISEFLKSKQTDEITGLTDSSKRFALIILSYQMLRESLLYYYYNVDEYGTLDDDTCKKIVDIKSKCKDFVEFAQNKEIIKNLSWSILDIMTENLILKTKKAIISKNGRIYKMLSTVLSAGLFGIDGYIVTVECNSQARIPAFAKVALNTNLSKDSFLTF